MKTKRRSDSGFTLVELLVVIGIIALLISVLLPALSRARQSANSVKCLANLNQIGLAVLMYANENKNYIVPGCYYPASNVMAQPWESILIQAKYVPGQGTPNQTDGFITNTVFHCPDAIDAIRSADPASFTDGNGACVWRCQSNIDNLWYDTTYGMNGTYYEDGYAILNEADGQLPGSALNPPPHVSSNSATDADITPQKMTEFRDSSSTCLFFDGYFMSLASVDGGFARVNARHMKRTRTNVLFLDGHAANFLTVGNFTQNSADYKSAAALSQYPKIKWRLDQQLYTGGGSSTPGPPAPPK